MQALFYKFYLLTFVFDMTEKIKRNIIPTEFRKTHQLEVKAFEWIERIAEQEDRKLGQVLRRLAVEAYKKEHKIK